MRRRNRREYAWFYNLRVGRDLDQVGREIRAILSTRPAALGVCEAVGYRLPFIAGYWLVRDTTDEGRANVAAYVRSDLPVSKVRWTECQETWDRPKGPGRHWARWILSFLAADVQFIVHHQAPRWVDNEYPAQWEGLEKLTWLMAPWTRAIWHDRTRKQRKEARQRPRLVMMDANRTGRDSGPSPAVLARAVKGRLVPQDRIDCMVASGQIQVRGYTRPSSVAGVRLKSDHPNALRVDLRIPRKWLTTKEKQ